MKFAVFVLCCAADLFVLRPVWLEHQIAAGQFRRGYFEQFRDAVGLAVDDAVRPSVIPSYLVTDDGRLAVPPGMIAVAPIVPGEGYELVADWRLAPYVVIGEEGPLTPSTGDAQLAPGEGRLVNTRVLSLQGGALRLVSWDPTRPWRDDGERLSALRDGCAAREEEARLTLARDDDRLEVRLGRCAIAESLPASAALLLGVFAGPEWVTVARQPQWVEQRRVVWPIVGAVIVKVSAMWWGAGLVSAAATSAVLGIAAVPMPVPAILTWTLMLIAGVAAAVLRALAFVLRPLSLRQGFAAVLAVIVVVTALVWVTRGQPKPLEPNWRPHGADQPDACAVIGYSTVEDQGLRRERGGIRWILDERCDRCRDKTASLSFGGATLTWARGAYCGSDASFGQNGAVVFLGGANDDFLTGVVALARMFVIGRQGAEAWRRNQAAAAAASLGQLATQTETLESLVQCGRSRGAHFLFLHDFLVTDMPAGRTAERAAMLSARRNVVDAAGGTFVDLLDVFGAEAGISWFNDYVHFSAVAHARIADRGCRELR